MRPPHPRTAQRALAVDWRPAAPSRRAVVIGLLTGMLVLCSGCSLLSRLRGVARDSLGKTSSEDPVAARLVTEAEAQAITAARDLTLVVEDERCHTTTGSYITERDLAENLAEIACHYNLASGSHSAHVELHNRFDDRKYDHLLAATIMVVCVSGEGCKSPVAVGQMTYYAEHTDAAAVDTGLKALAGPESFKDVFQRRFAAALQLIRIRSAALDSRRRALYVEVPRQVRARRVQHWKKYPSLWARFDEIHLAAHAAMVARDVPAGLIDRAMALREEYVRSCVQDGEMLDACFQGPLARPLTEQIIEMAIATGQRILGDAENSIIRHKDDLSGAATEIWIQQYRAMEEERRKYDEWRRARESGIDPTTLARTYGDPPPLQVDAGAAWRPLRGVVDYGPLLANLSGPAPEPVEGVVARVQRRDRTAVIHFLDIVATWDDHDCVETNQIDRIEGGRIIYRQRCKYKRTHTDRRKIDPVTVDVRSARGLSAGNRVLTLVDPDRHGTVVYAFLDDRRQDRVTIRGVGAGE
jgi:hypothetical protein